MHVFPGMYTTRDAREIRFKSLATAITRDRESASRGPRDLQPTRPGETRPKTSHRDIASNNSRKLQQLGTQVTISVDTRPLRYNASCTKLGPRHAPGTSVRR